MKNITNCYDPYKKFSESFLQLRDSISKEKLEKFDEFVDKNDILWVMYFDGAENIYIVIANVARDIFTDGILMTEDDFVASIDEFLD